MKTANVEYASPGIRLSSYFLEGVLMICTLGIDWLLWALTCWFLTRPPRYETFPGPMF